ncbi:MAG: acetyl-CoA carboxylase biotin carboxylase subunit, partial [Gammaproteobacteria bacterium]|nr:acetyl-CoA carboxylase biotin carboxylase subunit [Gammaproteobacteria bacterium]
MFRRLLIANRGEIACRIIATARRLGITTLAVYSEADRDARHVRLADEAVCLGPAEAAQSYLDVARLLEAARQLQAEAVHPGYGFLSENAAFAEACVAAGLVFVGPSAQAIRDMGDKRRAKALMAAAGVPVVPGDADVAPQGAAGPAASDAPAAEDPAAEDARLAAAAAAVGYPVLLKAAAGGGGKGMRVVTVAEALPEALAAARREARAAFGDDRLLLEKYLAAPRHIEVQVFADTHGNVVHLHERDCSVQRRHQKVLEEARAPDLDPALRTALGEAAVAAARAIDYVGAGTVEFLCQDGCFWFMEMNTRLQVEHPVTEAITGEDLVAWQLRVAAGEPLPRAQAEIACLGHALEARLYAEDPARDYLPATGTLWHLRLPAGEGVRVDSGVDPGDVITPYYDPMIAKLVTHGRDRGEALARMRQALAATEIAGVATNLPLLGRILADADFARGAVTTRYLEARPTLAAPAGGELPSALPALAALALHCTDPDAAVAGGPWQQTEAFRLNLPGRVWLEFTLADEAYAGWLVREPAGWRVALEGQPPVSASLRRLPGALDVELAGQRLRPGGGRPGAVGVGWVGGGRGGVWPRPPG